MSGPHGKIRLVAGWFETSARSPPGHGLPFPSYSPLVCVRREICGLLDSSEMSPPSPRFPFSNCSPANESDLPSLPTTPNTNYAASSGASCHHGHATFDHISGSTPSPATATSVSIDGTDFSDQQLWAGILDEIFTIDPMQDSQNLLVDPLDNGIHVASSSRQCTCDEADSNQNGLQSELPSVNEKIDPLDIHVASPSRQCTCDEADSNQNGLQSELPAINEKTHVQNQLTVVPEKGMEFSSEEEAYESYKKYAQQIGFSVRKGKVNRLADRRIRKRYLYCSREGIRSSKPSSNNITKYQRRETRTGCKAGIQITNEGGKWVISDVVLNHNHDLDRATVQRSLELSEPTDCPIQENLFTDYNSKEPDPSTEHPMDHINASISKKGGATNNLDSNNYLPHSTLNSLQPHHVQSLIDCFKHLQVADPSFLYTIQVDAESQSTNFFWRDGRSRIDYDCFGDVLVLNMNKSFEVVQLERCNMICASFWGVNHHQQCILFGCALLLDVTKDSFLWLLKTFMETMGNRSPKTIYTDESEAISSALKVVFPETEHRVGICYIIENAKKHLSTCYEHYPDFESTFNRCIFECSSKQEFESEWNLLQDKYGLLGNSWLDRVFALREKWSHLFFNNKKAFTAGVESTLNSMSINIVFQTLEGTNIMPGLVWQCVQEAEKRRLEETNEDFRTCNETVPSKSRKGLEKHAEDIYTSAILRMFENEYVKSMNLEMEEVTSLEGVSMFKFIDKSCKKDEGVSLMFNRSVPSLACGCAKFESFGILCSHSLKVLCSRNVSHIPDKYVLRRWTKSAKNGVVMQDEREEMAGESSKQSSLYSRKLMHRALHLIAKSAPRKETRRIMEDCLDTAQKKVENILKTKGMKHLSITNFEVDCEDDCDGSVNCGSYKRRKGIGSNSSFISQEEGTKKKK